MVLPGQYLERPTLIVRTPATDSSSGITLEGLYHRGSQAPAVVICAPHPRMGGSMDSAVVAELAWSLTRSGHASLRFNYQGVGASEGEIQAASPGGADAGPASVDSLSSEIDDALAAVSHLQESVDHRRIALAGYSFGAAVALGVARRLPSITHLMLVAPPTSLFDFSVLSAASLPTLVVAGQHDNWVDQRFMGECAGGVDALRWEVIPNADHTFSRGLTDLGRTVTSWLDATRTSR